MRRGGRVFSGEEEGRESEKRERVERGYGPQPRPGRAQSTRCKNANRPPPAQSSSTEKRERSRESKRGRPQGKKCCKSKTNDLLVLYVRKHKKDRAVGDVR